MEGKLQPTVLNDSAQEITSSAMQPGSSNTGNDANDVVIGPDTFNFIARLVGEANLLLISEKQAVVGRASPQTNVDFPAADNKLISRHHFVIQYCNAEFSVVCLSKNGVYMGDTFLPKSDTPYKMQTSCYFRFPSTDIKVFFENLIGPTPDLGLLVERHMLPFSLLYNVPVVESEATVNNNYENTEKNHDHPTISPYLLNTFGKLLGPVPANIPSSEQTGGAIVEATDAPQEIAPSALPAAGPVISANDKQLTSKPPSRDRNKPSFTYCQLIVQAIKASPSQQLTLAEIYTYLKETYPYFRARPGGGWQNSIRHNLSLNRYFVKIPRTDQVAVGKGNYWRIDNNIYSKVMANRYKKTKRSSATITYFNGKDGASYHSAPASPNYESESRLARPMDCQMSVSVPGSPVRSRDEYQ